MNNGGKKKLDLNRIWIHDHPIILVQSSHQRIYQAKYVEIVLFDNIGLIPANFINIIWQDVSLKSPLVRGISTVLYYAPLLCITP